jgi:ferrous iron transport protein A
LPLTHSGAGRLSDVPVGSSAVLTHHPSLHGAALRLAELGLRAGARVVVLHRTAGGGRIVGVGHARIALDRRVTRHLRVQVDVP